MRRSAQHEGIPVNATDPVVGGSLLRRVLALALSAVIVVWLGSAVFAYVDARHEANEILDGYLAQSAALLAAQAAEDLDELDVEHAPQLHKYARRVAFQIWDRGEVLRVHSANAPDRRLLERDEGFGDVTVDGHAWRAFSSWDRRHRYLIQVAEARDARDEIATSVARSVLLPLLVALPLLAVLLWWAVASGLRPLRSLGAQVARRDPDNLARIDAQSPPAEVAPLVSGLNHLFERVAHSLGRERRFTADAAHELRTPIAALRTQAQVAQRASDDATRTHALLQVIAGCDRAARLVDQMLTLARLDPARAPGPAVHGDVTAIARGVLADLAPAALDKSVDVELDAAGAAEVAGDPDLLAIMLRNLVDNAIRYSAAGSRVVVSVMNRARAVELRVTDSGPGVPADERERLGERFYRGLGTSESGSGLGLSIVRRIAEVHGTVVTYGAPTSGTGLVVTVLLPKPPADCAPSR